MNSLVLSVFATLTALIGVISAQNQVCPAPFGHFPSNLNDGCATFYWCWNGRGHLRKCPNGLSFDINTLTCANQQQVACVNNNQVAAPLGVQRQGGIAGQIQQPAINQVQVAGIQAGAVPDNPAVAVQPFNNQPVNPLAANVPAQFPVNAGLGFPAGVGGRAGGGVGAGAGSRAAAGANAEAGANAVGSAGARGQGAVDTTNAAAGASADAVARAAGGGTGAGVGAGAASIAGAGNGNQRNQPFAGTAFNLPGNVNAPGQPFAANNWGQGVPGGQGVLGDLGQGRVQLPGNQGQGPGQTAGAESGAVPVVLANQHQSATINQAQTVGVGPGK